MVMSFYVNIYDIRGYFFDDNSTLLPSHIRRYAIGIYTIRTGHLLYMCCGEKSPYYGLCILKAALYAKLFQNFKSPPTVFPLTYTKRNKFVNYGVHKWESQNAHAQLII